MKRATGARAFWCCLFEEDPDTEIAAEFPLVTKEVAKFSIDNNVPSKVTRISSSIGAKAKKNRIHEDVETRAKKLTDM